MIILLVLILFFIGSILTIAGEKKKNKPAQIIGYIVFVIAAVIPAIEIIKYFF